MSLLIRTVVALVLTLAAVAAIGQQTSPPAGTSTAIDNGRHPPAATDPPTNGDAQQPQTSEDVLRQEEKQRALGVVPMFAMTNVRNAPPLSVDQKFRLMTRTMIDPFTFVAAGITAGLGQANDSFPEYGQGAEGFGKRYASALADGADSNFFSNFVYPVIFKQDPRYFRAGEGTIKRRIAIAVKQEFVARQDDGSHTFHFSNVLGAATAGSISNIYYPMADRGVGLTASRGAIALGYGCLGNLFLEFWPDIDRKLFHKQSSEAHPSEPPGGPPK